MIEAAPSPRTVLITGARAPVAIDLARSFAKAGYDVRFVESIKPWAASFSSAKSGKILKVAPPRYEFDRFADDLHGLIERFDPLLIVPTCEEVFYVSAAAQRHGFLHRLFAPPLQVLDKLHSKYKFVQHAQSLGIRAPDTWRVTSPAELRNVPLPLGQCVIKPEYSRFGTSAFIKPSAKILERIRPTVEKPWIVQDFIQGDEICLWTAASAGKIVASAAYRPIWRHGKSASYAFERIENAAALSIAEKIAADDNLSGHLSFDIMLTPEGEAIPIECNPRATSGLHLFDARAELGQAIIANALIAAQPAELRYLSAAMYVLGVPKAILSGRVGELLRDIRRGRDALGRPGDRLPVLGTLIDSVRFAMLGLKRVRTAASETTDDIEWNGQKLL